MHPESSLEGFSLRLSDMLLVHGQRLVTAESCTGGYLAKVLTDIPGSSRWFECGYVCYSNAAKTRDLKVSPHTLARDGAVSEAVASEMAAGALNRTGASIAMAITGIAGPEGAQPGKPVGTVWFCAAIRRKQAVELCAQRQFFSGSRASVRNAAVEHALKLLLQLQL